MDVEAVAASNGQFGYNDGTNYAPTTLTQTPWHLAMANIINVIYQALLLVLQ